MFCTNCGTKLNDDALFCTNCGARVNDVPEAVPVTRPAAEPVKYEDKNEQVAVMMQSPAAVTSKEVVPLNISIQPVPNTVNAQQLTNDKPQYTNIPYSEPDTLPQVQKQKKTIIPLAVLSLIFALLTIGAAIAEMLDDASGVQDIARLIEMMISVVVIIIYAFSNNRTVSVLKGIALSILLISDIIFVGYSSIKYAIDSFGSDITILAILKDVNEETVTAYFISILVWCGSMYIFFIIDAIRSFAGARGAKTITLFFGYIAILGIIVQMVLKMIIDGELSLILGFVPVNLIYIFLILTIAFGISAKKKIKITK